MTDNISELSFETALQELETLVRKLEEGKVNLEDSIASYERGTALKQHCEEKLREARMRVEKIMVGTSDGTHTTQPFETS